MSCVALQRVLVRMLYDPGFVDRVLQESEAALAGVELSDEEHTWLRAADPRAWRTDPYRRSRSLEGLLEEFSVGSALVVQRAGGVPTLDAFFSSDGFHHGMQAGASLAALYATYLESENPEHAPYVRLEAAIARTRRPGPAANPSQWGLAPHVALTELPGGTRSAYGPLRNSLERRGRVQAAWVVDPSRKLHPPPLAAEPEYLLIRDTGAGVELESLSPELHAILAYAQAGASTRALHRRCVELGAEPGDVEEILSGFVQTGELRPPDAATGPG